MNVVISNLEDKIILELQPCLNDCIVITSEKAIALFWSHEVDMLFFFKVRFSSAFLEKLRSLKYIHFQNFYFH